jgi:hypothetical protein
MIRLQHTVGAQIAKDTEICSNLCLTDSQSAGRVPYRVRRALSGMPPAGVSIVCSSRLECGPEFRMRARRFGMELCS